MRIIHSIGKKEKEGEGVGSIFLPSDTGGYLSLNSDSNFQGWTFFNRKMYKMIDNIYLDKEVNTVHNFFSHVERDSGSTTEQFLLFQDILFYEVRNYAGVVNIDLDFRELYNSDDKGRKYEFYKKEGNILIIKYQKFTNDSMHELEWEHYVAIKNAWKFSFDHTWKYKNYEYDSKRNSKSDFYIFGPLKIVPKGSKLVFSHANNEEDAILKVNEGWHEFDFIKDAQKTLRMEKLHYDLPLSAAINSLNGLHTNKGLFAGYPWFFQYWGRDELISCKALMLQGEYFKAKEILFKYLNKIGKDGWFDNLNFDSDLKSADTAGWLFLRLHEFIEILRQKNKLFDILTKDEMSFIKLKLEKTIQSVIKNHMKEGLIWNDKLETWMDTNSGVDYREGARIEIQALQLRIYKFAVFINQLFGDEYKIYEDLEKHLKKNVKDKFFKKGLLADGYFEGSDFTQRPNIFLAYYIYPELFTKSQWNKIFKNALDKLWLKWGGLSSIDKDNSLFKDETTGETNESYHRGDSWFYVNNIAAIAMKQLDAKKYKSYIDKITKTSVHEMLFSGFLGHCAEISSAKELRSEGCRCQAWSAATLIELLF